MKKPDIQTWRMVGIKGGGEMSLENRLKQLETELVGIITQLSWLGDDIKSLRNAVKNKTAELQKLSEPPVVIPWTGTFTNQTKETISAEAPNANHKN